MSRNVKHDTKILDTLEKIMRRNKATVKIGIIGDGVAREDGDISNAEVGAIHEFGQGDLPVRSFLRMPLNEKLGEAVEKDGISPETMREAVKSRGLKKMLKRIGLLAETIIGDAFDTGGFGEWEKSDFSRKKNEATLVEEQELRNSISSEVIT